MKYILYKNPVQLDTLAIVHYLFSEKNIDLSPHVIFERNHPNWVSSIPSILYDDEKFIGLSECIRFYEKYSGITNLLSTALKWKQSNQNYHLRFSNE